MVLSKEFIQYMSKANPKLAEALNSGFEKNYKLTQENNKVNMYKQSSKVFGEFITKASEVEVAENKEQPVNFQFLAKDAYIKDEMLKFAGMVVYDTTPEGIEQFLKEYMYNELSYFPDKINIMVGIVPLDNSPVNNGTGQLDPNISNASGTIDLMYGGALIQIPWVMRDKEILPFDTIQLGTETAVYTRENLRNILFNIKNMVEKQQTAGVVGGNPSLASYIGAEKPTGKLTDTGFMQDMLQIQSLLGSNNAAYAYASKKVDELLEKTASITEVNINYKELHKELVKEYMKAAEKVAYAEYDEPEEKQLEKQALFDTLEKEVLADVQILKNGSKFIFTEKDGMIVSKVPAAIFKSLASVDGVNITSSMVVTSDGRFKILMPGQRFMFNLNTGDNNVETEIGEFQFKTKDIGSLNPGHTYTAEIGGTYLLPFIITKAVSGARMDLHAKMFYYCVDVQGREFMLMPVANVSDNQMCLQSKKQIIGQAAKTEDPKKLAKYNVILKEDLPILCLSNNTKLIKLNQGTIKNMESAKEAMLLYDGNVKLASFTDKVVVTLISAEGNDPKFNLDATWFDRKQKMDRKISFNNLSEPKLKGILKTMGFDYNKVSEIVYRTKKEHTATYELGAGTTPWLVKPEVSAGMAAENTIENMRKSFFTEDNARKAIVGVLGGLLGGMAASTALGDKLVGLKSLASESEALAEKLEKIAISRKSPTFTKLAGLMVIKNRIDNLLVNSLEGKEFEGAEVLAELHEVDPYMQKVAYDLVELKLHQAMFKDEIISPNVINATLRHLDGLHKYANHFSLEKGASINGASHEVVLQELDKEKRSIKNTTISEPAPAKGTRAPGLIGDAAEFVMTPAGMVGTLVAGPLAMRKVNKLKSLSQKFRRN